MPRKPTKREKREAVRVEIQEWSAMAFPDARDIPEDLSEGIKLQEKADRRAAQILERIMMDGLL